MRYCHLLGYMSECLLLLFNNSVINTHHSSPRLQTPPKSDIHVHKVARLQQAQTFAIYVHALPRQYIKSNMKCTPLMQVLN